jgi:hypothetical protein
MQSTNSFLKLWRKRYHKILRFEFIFFKCSNLNMITDKDGVLEIRNGFLLYLINSWIGSMLCWNSQQSICLHETNFSPEGVTQHLRYALQVRLWVRPLVEIDREHKSRLQIFVIGWFCYGTTSGYGPTSL